MKVSIGGIIFSEEQYNRIKQVTKQVSGLQVCQDALFDSLMKELNIEYNGHVWDVIFNGTDFLVEEIEGEG